MTPEEVLERVRMGGLLSCDGALVAMLSGGRDSVCLLDLAVIICGAENVHALHVNYGLRPESDEEQRHCQELCERLGVALKVVRAERTPGAGNLQAWARDLRYGEALRLARELDARQRDEGVREPDARLGGEGVQVSDTRPGGEGVQVPDTQPGGEDVPREAPIATGHTATDQVETILYRLAASPGRRALLGMSPREGRLVRPLLELTREQTADYCRARGLPWREDPSNDNEQFARAKVRNRLLPALDAVHPAAQENVLRTARLLREEAEVLDGLVDAQLGGGEASIAISRLRLLPAALARLVVVRLAEQTAGAFVPQAGARVGEILALAERGGRAELHVGGLVGAVIEDGRLRMVSLPPRA